MLSGTHSRWEGKKEQTQLLGPRLPIFFPLSEIGAY